MDSHFENLFKQLFIEKCYRKDDADVNSEELKVTLEYRKIIDKVVTGIIKESFQWKRYSYALLKLARMERIIIVFNIMLRMSLSEIAYVLDTSIDSIYTQKSTALKKLKTELNYRNNIYFSDKI